MSLRKFEILSVELSPGGAGPQRAYRIKYRAIGHKEWVEDLLWVIARNEQEAREQAERDTAFIDVLKAGAGTEQP